MSSIENRKAYYESVKAGLVKGRLSAGEETPSFPAPLALNRPFVKMPTLAERLGILIEKPAELTELPKHATASREVPMGATPDFAAIDEVTMSNPAFQMLAPAPEPMKLPQPTVQAPASPIHVKRLPSASSGQLSSDPDIFGPGSL